MFALHFPHRLKDLECPQDNDAAAEVAPPRIIDESWLFGQVSVPSWYHDGFLKLCNHSPFIPFFFYPCHSLPVFLFVEPSLTGN